MISFAGCTVLFFETPPQDTCDVPGRVEELPCGPCTRGTLERTCGQNHRWVLGPCLENELDLDGDGFANDSCFESGLACCGERDCDDSEALRFPGALADLDGDERYDTRCCDLDDSPWCDDCDDDDEHRWGGHADLDEDGHDDVACGGDDCDDQNAERWWGHADFDGDGHVDMRCCEPGTLFCDDCDDDDPLRWLDHADLDGDGHASASCCDAEGACGDDCDDWHPERWTGHADVDGDGHVDDRCCEASTARCDDCNDSDPLRWTGNADLDGDGHVDARCRCDPTSSDCSLNDDCDDDCETCLPGGSLLISRGRDHDCSYTIDELEVPLCPTSDLSLLGRESSTVDGRAVFVVGQTAFMASTEGLHAIDVSDPESPLELDRLVLGSARDVAVWGDLVLVATAEGLVVVRWLDDRSLARLSGPVDTGDSRAVAASGGLAFVGSYEGVSLVDLSSPTAPVVVSSLGEPWLGDVRDLYITDNYVTEAGPERAILVASRRALELPEGGLSGFRVGEGLVLEPLGRLDLAGVGRVAEGCADLYGVIVEGGLELVALLRAPRSRDHFELEGARGLAIGCFQAGPTSLGENVAYVVADDGLHALQGFATFQRSGYLPLEGVPRDVFAMPGRAYLATDQGLQIVSLGCR